MAEIPKLILTIAADGINVQALTTEDLLKLLERIERELGKRHAAYMQEASLLAMRIKHAAR
jgi:hypothetical protein